MRVEIAPGSVLSLVLIDLSNSINQNAASLEFRKQAAIRYVDNVLSAESVALTGPHFVAVFAFDGRREVQPVSVGVGSGTGDLSHWSNNAAALRAAINNLECGDNVNGFSYCQDPSTNLHGAVIWAAEFLTRVGWRLNVRNSTCGSETFLVFFTDGLDQANYGPSAADTGAAVATAGIKAFAVGRASDTVRHVMETICRDPNAVLLAGERAGIPDQFEVAARQVVAYASRAYRITWCSTRRAGTHPVGVRARYGNNFGPSAGYVVGEEVVYTGGAFGGTANSRAVVTEVDRFNDQGAVYRVRLVGSALAIAVSGSELNRTYTPPPIWNPTCLRDRSTISAAGDTPAGQSPAPALYTSGAAPYSCVGGSEFICATQKCTCALDATPLGGGVCPDQLKLKPPTDGGIRDCVGGFPQSPAAFDNVETLDDSRITATFTAACSDGMPVGGISFSPCQSDLSSLSLWESDASGDYERVSFYESRPRVTCLGQPAHVLSVLLLDLSASMVRGAGGLTELKAGVSAYLDGLQEFLRSHMVSVYTFDGRVTPQLLIGFTDDLSAVRQAVAGLECDGVIRCADPASNLYGSLVYANSTAFASYYSGLAAFRTTGVDASKVAVQDGIRRVPYLVVFSDGTDTACRASEEEAIRAAQWGKAVLSVGLRGEIVSSARTFTSNTLSSRGVNFNFLSRLSTSGVFSGAATELTQHFREVGEAVATASTSQYRLDYCTPKRTGMRRFRLTFTPTSGANAGRTVVMWEAAFDAGQFRCDDGRCARCHGGDEERKSCTNQPDPFEQSFVCEGDAAPVSAGGYCRCPCGNGAYPTTPGPGPVVCQAPGTCFGERPPPEVCKRRGGLRQPAALPGWDETSNFYTASDGTRFGVSTSSRVSFEFVPQCADQWPIPGLRVSACDALSDFTVWETDVVTGAALRVDPWESEPRVVCHPDIVTFLLLDTSGSVKQSEGGEEALRQSVVYYLDQLNVTATELDVSHHVAIYAFDGRASLQEIIGYGDASRARAAMQAWRCDGSKFCADPSTDLHGAVVSAEALISAEQLGLSWATSRFMVVFTDGTDQAARVSLSAAVNAVLMSPGLRVYGVGLTGESDQATVGLDLRALRRIGFSGVYVSPSSTELPLMFGQVAAQARAAVSSEASATYRIDFCSPKRSGMRRAVVRLTLDNQTVEWNSPEYNAGSFDCDSGACAACLRHRQYSCPNQPQQAPGERDPQFFSCSDSQGDPLPLPGALGNLVCKCPCEGTYPPDPIALPTPAPGTTVVSVPVFFCPLCSPAGCDNTVCSCGGTYTAPLAVQLRTGTEGAAMYYTLDGSVPSEGALRYTGTLSIIRGGPNTVRAVSVRENLLSATAQCELRIRAPNAPPVAAPFLSAILATVGVPVNQRNAVTGVSGPETDQTVTAVCSTPAAGFFSAGPVMNIQGTEGVLSFTAARAGNAIVVCNLTDSGEPRMSVEVTLTVQASTSPTPPSTDGCPAAQAISPNQWLRIGVTQYNAALFTSAVQSATAVTLPSPVVCVYSVCPASACPNGVCPATTIAKTQAGCTVSSNHPQSRAGSSLQTGFYVDFLTAATTPSAQSQANGDLVAESQKCLLGSSCSLSALAPTSVVSTVGPTPSPPVVIREEGGDDDPEWLWILLGVLAGVAVIGIIVVIVCCCCRNKEREKSREMQSKAAASAPQYSHTKSYPPTFPASYPNPSYEQPPSYPKGGPSYPQVVGPVSAGSPAEDFPLADKGVSFVTDSYGQSYPPPAEGEEGKGTEYSYQTGEEGQGSTYEYDGGTYEYEGSVTEAEGVFTPGQGVRGMYLDGQWYDAKIISQEGDGSYTVQWYDGTFSDAVPARQLEPK
eukprot:Hpha_TRINITY_DN16303_c2_g5::TRINITY_DN16303_c2_g5_i2::g.61829::m.61829